MTTKRDGRSKKDEPKAAERPKLKKETLKDLAPDRKAEGVKGGAPMTVNFSDMNTCTCRC